ncbi:MAG: DUF5107 domain-containing protein [Renibacterium sp.]|nr:DUF5107 domain-containing protein [Renibacterium sp.]
MGLSSALTIRTESVSSAQLGPENPLANIGKPLEAPYQISGDVPAEIIANSTYGHPATLHPYRLQDRFSRIQETVEMPVVILENAQLRAKFLPALGGRLWELFDKNTGKHLLHTPGQIQFGNLALRNAWFAGGIEWNIGTRGHSPSTCAPLHSAVVDLPDGGQALRMWEFERLRNVVFQIDAWLPADSPVLKVAIRISNPNEHEVPIYWWSNAAVPQTEHTRVIAPASSAFASDYENGIKRRTPQELDGVDCTWPERNRHAADYFFDLAPQERRWIAAADADGDGLAMLSTERLRGRKLFVWGEGDGGRRWQEWLSPDGGKYAEIQAGLAQTQFENLPLAAGESWAWLECYGNARLTPGLARASWPQAVEHAGQRVEQLLPAARLESDFTAWSQWADAEPRAAFHSGSGWGALESRRRTAQGQAPWAYPGTPFGAETLGLPQKPWLELLATGNFAGADDFVAGSDWSRALGLAAGSQAQIAFHLGTLAQAEGRLAEAAAGYRRCLEAAPDDAGLQAAALRGLALAENDPQRYLQACALAPGNRALVVEAASALLADGLAESASQVLAGFSAVAGAEAAADGRVEFLRIQALAALGRTAEAAAALQAGITVADLREGENSLAGLWQRLFPGTDIPQAYQFGMAD